MEKRLYVWGSGTKALSLLHAGRGSDCQDTFVGGSGQLGLGTLDDHRLPQCWDPREQFIDTASITSGGCHSAGTLTLPKRDKFLHVDSLHAFAPPCLQESTVTVESFYGDQTIAGNLDRVQQTEDRIA